MTIIMNQSSAACGIILAEDLFRNAMQIQRSTFSQQARMFISGLLSLSTLVLLAACATPDWGPVAEPTPRSGAELAFSRGNYAQAASTWQQEALDAEPASAAKLRVRAADAWLLAGEPGKARDMLRWIDRSDLTAQDQSRLDLVLADMALRQNRPDEADSLLRQAQPALPSSARSRYESLKTQTAQQLDSPAMRDISKAAALSDSMAYYNPRNSIEMMRLLENVPSGELAIRADNPRAERQLTGWLDLALIIRQNLVIPDGITVAVAGWKTRHPYHLLSEAQALDTWLSYRQLFHPPRKVAVLLPGSGRLQAASEAIRDGVMAAYLENSGGAEILFFPSGDDEQSAISAYFNALDSGVDWIIGPLRKELIEAMLNLAGMATPVLALNDLPADFIAPAYLAGRVSGISLSQESEAAAAAAHAAASGYKRAIVLAPESAWGERMAYAFEAEFLQEDREIVAAMRYLESQNDHSATLQRALKIDQSKARKKKLENTLQMQLEFEPSRRDDVDVIFMAANASQARQIRPQLRFHDAGDIPVYATGRVFSGQPNPSRNQDLNGVRFPATPWQLAHTLKEEIPDLSSLRKGTLGSLFAVGKDAWNLLPWLDLMNKDPDFVFPGQSGYYRAMGSKGLMREPAWAEFSRGRPVALPEPRSMSLQQAPQTSGH
jgi:outer membrane PBP1 activator LpoA protein